MRLEGYKVREDLRGRGDGNLPAWAGGDPTTFFKAADQFERKNGTAGKELIAAVPRQLPAEFKKLLIAELVEEIVGSSHGFCYGFHIVRSSDGGTNPHVHLLWSERTDDGLQRSQDLYFARAIVLGPAGNPVQDPSRGGCRKSREFALLARGRTGFAASPELLRLRRWWAERCNYWLAQVGVEPRLSERSYKAQGIARIPGVHMYESARQIARGGGQSTRLGANAAAMAANASKTHGRPEPKLSEGSDACAPDCGPGKAAAIAASVKQADFAAQAQQLRDALERALSEDAGPAGVRRKKLW